NACDVWGSSLSITRQPSSPRSCDFDRDRSLLFRHRGGMMACDQPLVPVPPVRSGVPRLHLAAVVERKRVEPRIDGSVAVDFDHPRIDLADRLFFEEMDKIVLLFRGGEPG